MEIILHFALNCFLLFIPVFIWNAALYRKLPSGYQKPAWDEIPRWIAISENVLRIIVFILPLFLRLSLTLPVQRAGLILYGCGILLYFLSWLIPIRAPESRWSRSGPGFTAPAYTTILWLAGIMLMGQETTVGLPYEFFMYGIVCLLFWAVHTGHAWLVFRQQSRQRKEVTP